MKVLLDHNLLHKLRTRLASLSAHEFVTASFLGWGALQNGVLLRAAEEGAFDVFVTGDRTLVHEQDFSTRRMAVIALSANNWPIIKDFAPRILAAVDRVEPGALIQVDCGTLSRSAGPGQARS